MHPRSMRIGGHMDSGDGGVGGLKTRPYDGKIAGLYDLEETLGSGHFAVVKLARHVFTGEKVAVKVIDKSKLDEVSKSHLFQEVRCMKLVQHPNVVRLYEVIDTATKLYLILEWGDGGDLYDYIMRHDSGLSEQLAREYFRQIVRAISYCHQLHVVHRDLKPENVVFFEKLGVVKLTDFGFSNKFCPGQKLETSCGSLAYSAPEILLGDSYDAPAVDVWSLGVILYMLVCGQAPFHEANDSETLTMIMDCKYSIPAHIPDDCKDLISKMLVKNPEKRATLSQISKHPWLAAEKDEPQLDVPLVSRKQLSEEDHNFIVQKIVNGDIATKEEIQESLDKDEYNHITATYYLLAERRLRASRQEQSNKTPKPKSYVVSSSVPQKQNNLLGLPHIFLHVPKTPGDVPQRARKCSIVQEDEEEEDISSCSAHDELSVPLNKHGSKSEGRLNIALQERLAESERRKPSNEVVPQRKSSKENISQENSNVAKEKTAQPAKDWKGEKSASISESPVKAKIMKNFNSRNQNSLSTIPTTHITESSTISIPIVTSSSALLSQNMPKYKTMPSPTKSSQMLSPTAPLLNEIFEEGDTFLQQKPARHFLSRNQNRTTYEQRKSKFSKNRTASCSSSDASDEDSEQRKKQRASKLSNAPNVKNFQGRRDSHDDSSDSQEPGPGCAASQRVEGHRLEDRGASGDSQCNNQNGSATETGTSSGGGKQHHDHNRGTVLLEKRHKSNTGNRRNGETRLRESQSLNRITEVQEDLTSGSAHALVVTTAVVGTQGAVTPKTSKGITVGLFQGLNLGQKKLENQTDREEKATHVSRKDATKSADNMYEKNRAGVNKAVLPNSDRGGSRRMRLIGKYLQVHKRLCMPIQGLFTKNRLYKAQSCGSLTRDKITTNAETKQRAVSVIRNMEETDQNRNNKAENRKSATSIQLNNVCNDLTGICAIHLGQASKCCSFC